MKQIITIIFLLFSIMGFSQKIIVLTTYDDSIQAVRYLERFKIHEKNNYFTGKVDTIYKTKIVCKDKYLWDEYRYSDCESVVLYNTKEFYLDSIYKDTTPSEYITLLRQGWKVRKW